MWTAPRLPFASTLASPAPEPPVPAAEASVAPARRTSRRADRGAGRRRVFFALWPDAGAKPALSALAAAAARTRGGRPTRADQLHLTMAFIGEVAPAAMPLLRAAGVEAAAAAAPFVLTLDRPGGTARDGVAWLEATAPPAALMTLHDALAGALRRAGFATEARAFRPHVTLARRCTRPAGPDEAASTSWAAESLALVASTPAPGGSRYETIAEWPLAARPAGATASA
jgi:2'-5' RNA ligase